MIPGTTSTPCRTHVPDLAVIHPKVSGGSATGAPQRMLVVSPILSVSPSAMTRCRRQSPANGWLPNSGSPSSSVRCASSLPPRYHSSMLLRSWPTLLSSVIVVASPPEHVVGMLDAETEPVRRIRSQVNWERDRAAHQRRGQQAQPPAQPEPHPELRVRADLRHGPHARPCPVPLVTTTRPLPDPLGVRPPIPLHSYAG